MTVSQIEFRKKYLSVVTVGGLVGLVSLIVITACTDYAKAKINFVYKAPPSAGVMAKIGGELITAEVLFKDNKLDLFELEKKKYELQMDAVNRLLVERLVGAEAKKANMSLEDYIAKKIVGGEIKISDKEFKKFVAEKHIPESQINPQIKERINAYLQTMKKQDLLNDYVAKLTKGNPVELYFEKPKMKVAVEPGTGPTFGKVGAPITIVEFSDFQCPFCGRAAETVTQLKKKYGNKISLTFRHFPLPMHKDARPASEASMCINEQSTDKFWKFHDLAFKNQDKLDKANLEKFAKDVGADVKKYTACVEAKKYADFVQKDVEYGEKIGVKSTPTFFVNGQLVNGAVPIETFSEIIDEELSDRK